MVKKDLMIIMNVEQDVLLSLEELCRICHSSPDFIKDLIDYDIIHPIGIHPQEWAFNLLHLQRIKIAQRVQKDLEINIAGIALILELLDEIRRLRAKADLADKYFL